jgi:hypothetical protein
MQRAYMKYKRSAIPLLPQCLQLTNTHSYPPPDRQRAATESIRLNCCFVQCLVKLWWTTGVLITCWQSTTAPRTAIGRQQRVARRERYHIRNKSLHYVHCMVRITQKHADLSNQYETDVASPVTLERTEGHQCCCAVTPA